MTRYTPGPWAVSKQKARRVTANGVIICNAVLRNQGGPKHTAYLKDEHEAEANAELIAAAPELLAMLQRMAALTSACTGIRFDSALWRDAEALIARATGVA